MKTEREIKELIALLIQRIRENKKNQEQDIKDNLALGVLVWVLSDENLLEKIRNLTDTNKEIK